MMALSDAFHDENSPNDLQMAYEPADHLFVLLGPVEESKILCLIQVSLEGQISQKPAFQSIHDQILWMISGKFADEVLPILSGARIVRIATHPSAMTLDYGSAAVELLIRYFEGKLTQLFEVETEDALETPQVNVTEVAQEFSLVEENVAPRTNLPPLLVPLRERRPERLHYLCVSFGLTLDRFCFWRKHKFAPIFIGNAPNRVTGEFTCMVLKPLRNDDVEAVGSDEWGFYGPFYPEFKQRLVELFASTYRQMNKNLAMSVLDPKINFVEQDPASASGEMKSVLEPREMKRLEAYINIRSGYILVSFRVAQMIWLGTSIMEVSSSKPLVCNNMGLAIWVKSSSPRACLVRFTSFVWFASCCTRVGFHYVCTFEGSKYSRCCSKTCKDVFFGAIASFTYRCPGFRLVLLWPAAQGHP